MDQREIEKLQESLDPFLAVREKVRVLEAGCGSMSYLDFRNKAYVVGLDLSERQLERNDSLDERILGDVETYPIPVREFDVIVCWNVLEHVPHPERAVRNFADGLRDDGIVILAIPNVRSIKGLVTKFTPYRFHLWVHRSLLGRVDAGTDGRGPFPTYLRAAIAPKALLRAASDAGLTVAYVSLYEGNQQKRLRARFRIVGPVWAGLRTVVRAVSFGAISPDRTDCLIVLVRARRSVGSRRS
jgi:2-polyprenyl-3-methyl-5-hydroxy-6-metoxy-1,4-benzoquinol methylase